MARPSYMLRIGSHVIYQSLINLGLYPNKSLTIQFPCIPADFFSHFVRGYFDGDGCVYLEMGRGILKKKIIKRLAVIFTSGSVKFLSGLQKQLRVSFDLEGKIYSGQRAYRLRFATNDSVKFFSLMYLNSNDIFLKRKLAIFLKYFKIRPERIDESVKLTFKTLAG